MKLKGLMLAAVALLALCRSFAQVSTGTIAGSVTDSTGAVVPNAQVRITDEETNVVRTVATDFAGIYRAPNLIPGAYHVDLSQPGFVPQSKRGLVLTLDQTLAVNFTLALGQQTETVTVVGGAAQLVSTDTSSLGAIVEQKEIQDLPLDGRNFQDLLGLTAGVAPGPQGSFSATFNINGGRGSGTSYLIDGLDVNSPSNDPIRVTPNLEAIGEFKIITNSFSAEYGRSMGGIINTHIKSGANAWHGSLFEFFRNRDLNARGFFDPGKNPYQDNQFGGSVGGKVIRDKLFIFTDYQGERLRQGVTASDVIPTPAQRGGDFSGLPPATVIYDPLNHQAFPGNRIPQTRFDQPSALMMSLLPAPNHAGAFNYVVAQSVPANWDRFDGRVDFNITSKDRVSGVITRSDLGTSNGPILGPRLNGNLITSITEQDCRSISVNYTRVLTPATVNELVVGFTRDNYSGPAAPGTQYEPTAGVRYLNTSPNDAITNGFPTYLIAGYSAFGAPAGGPYKQPNNIPQLTDAFSFVRGRHAFKAGAQFHWRRYTVNQSTWPHGLYAFSPLMTSLNAVGGNALASALLGYPLTGQRDIKPAWQMRDNEYGLYFQDDFKVTRRLTLNLGVRWDLFTPATEEHDKLSNFDPATVTMRLAAQNGNSRSTLDTNYRNFGPHIGFAYDLRGDGKTVVRGGYLVGYVPLLTTAVGVGTDRLTTNPPFAETNSQVFNFLSPTVRVSDGLALFTQDPNHPSGDVVFEPRRQPTPYAEEWNLDVQRALPGDLLLDVAYAGSHGVHLTGQVNLNQAPPSNLPATGRSRISNSINNVEALLNREGSIYHALQVKLQRRFSAGFYVSAGYTFSHSIDDGSYTTQGSAASTPQPQDSYDWRAERGSSDFDVRQRLVVSYIYEVPFGKGKKYAKSMNRVLDAAFGGWQINGITTAQSGRPFTPVLAANVINSGPGGALRPDRLASGYLPAGKQSITHWFDASAFVAPGKAGTTPFVFGNSGRNILTGPDSVGFNFSTFKWFRITERYKVVFRSEFFNIFNHPRFNLPNANVDTPQAGVITAAQTPRRIQFALKLVF